MPDADLADSSGSFALLPMHHVQLAIPGRLEQSGHPVSWDGEFPGHDRFYSVDPFGNRLEFLQARPD